MFIAAQADLSYEGMIIGEHSRDNDLPRGEARSRART